MIYTGLNRTGEIADIKAHGGNDISEVYGGIGESDPIYYKQREMVGTSPMQFKALGLPLKDYTILGNSYQDGTPTPDMPVDVVGCGVRTGNLWNEDYIGINTDAIYRPLFVGDGVFTLSTDFESHESSVYGRITDIFLLSGNASDGISSSKNGAYQGKNVTARSVDGYITIAYRANARTGSDSLPYCKTMLNLGSTALPYEPYGYKLPLTVNGTEYPIYLGQVETTRRIRKLVLTGEEVWMLYNGNYYSNVADRDSLQNMPCRCTHTAGGIIIDNGTVRLKVFASQFTTVASNLEEWKTYLAAQYANGTPVTVWYVLAEPETGIVSEPLRKIGVYADTISMAQASVTIPTIAGTNTLTVGTTVQPSSVSITGHIKPVTG